jgi:hypothetical protein
MRSPLLTLGVCGLGLACMAPAQAKDVAIARLQELAGQAVDPAALRLTARSAPPSWDSVQYANHLRATLGRKRARAEDVRYPQVSGRGVRVDLGGGTSIERLNFGDAAQAQRFAVFHADLGDSGLVSVRGDQATVLRGEDLLRASRGARRAAWGGELAPPSVDLQQAPTLLIAAPNAETVALSGEVSALDARARAALEQISARGEGGVSTRGERVQGWSARDPKRRAVMARAADRFLRPLGTDSGRSELPFARPSSGKASTAAGIQTDQDSRQTIPKLGYIETRGGRHVPVLPSPDGVLQPTGSLEPGTSYTVGRRVDDFAQLFNEGKPVGWVDANHPNLRQIPVVGELRGHHHRVPVRSSPDAGLSPSGVLDPAQRYDVLRTHDGFALIGQGGRPLGWVEAKDQDVAISDKAYQRIGGSPQPEGSLHPKLGYLSPIAGARVPVLPAPDESLDPKAHLDPKQNYAIVRRSGDHALVVQGGRPLGWVNEKRQPVRTIPVQGEVRPHHDSVLVRGAPDRNLPASARLDPRGSYDVFRRVGEHVLVGQRGRPLGWVQTSGRDVATASSSQIRVREAEGASALLSRRLQGK